MPSFLLTDRMDPALRERVLHSLRSDARARAGGVNRRRKNFSLRLIFISLFVSIGGFLFVTFRQSQLEFANFQSQVLKEHEAQVSRFSPAFSQQLQKALATIKLNAEVYEGDLNEGIDSEVKLDRLLAEPFFYVRGSSRGFQTQSDRDQSLRETRTDSFARCLVMPPTSVSESALLKQLGVVYSPKHLRGQFVDLGSALRASAFIDSSFAEQVRHADHMKHLQILEQHLKRAHLERALNYVDTKRLLVVLDEPKAAGTFADLDGEAEHYMRVLLFDLKQDRPLWRARRLVSPEWLSEKSRLTDSRELDSCRLAYELRAELNTPSEKLEAPAAEPSRAQGDSTEDNSAKPPSAANQAQSDLSPGAGALQH